MVHPVFIEAMVKFRRADLLADAERRRHAAQASRATPSLALRLRLGLGELLLALGHRLQCQSETCAATGHCAVAPGK